MSSYNIYIGTGFFELYKFRVEGDNEQEAVDNLIDMLEKDGQEGYFLTNEELEETPEDMYVIGGNHGRALMHHGEFRIVEADNM